MGLEVVADARIGRGGVVSAHRLGARGRLLQARAATLAKADRRANDGTPGPKMESEAEGQAQGCVDLAHSLRRHDAGALRWPLAAAVETAGVE